MPVFYTAGKDGSPFLFYPLFMKENLRTLLVGRRIERRHMTYTWRDVALYPLAVGSKEDNLQYTKTLPTFSALPYWGTTNISPLLPRPEPAALLADKFIHSTVAPLHCRSRSCTARYPPDTCIGLGVHSRRYGLIRVTARLPLHHRIRDRCPLALGSLRGVGLSYGQRQSDIGDCACERPRLIKLLNRHIQVAGAVSDITETVLCIVIEQKDLLVTLDNNRDHASFGADGLVILHPRYRILLAVLVYINGQRTGGGILSGLPFFQPLILLIQITMLLIVFQKFDLAGLGFLKACGIAILFPAHLLD